MKKYLTILTLSLLILSCSDAKHNSTKDQEISALQTELDSLKIVSSTMSQKNKGPIKTFLTFQENDAEKAMNYYIGLFENSSIIEIQRNGSEGPGKEGSIFVAKFELNGSQFMCSDSPIKHEWDFTPGVSIFVECKSEDEIETLFAKLSDNGQVFMPLDNYGFSPKFGFVEDRFGVSWQLILN